MTRGQVRAVAGALSTGVFLVFLALPILDSAIGFDRTPAPQEKRAPAAIPPAPHSVVALLEFPAGFDAFFADHFGCRNALIRLHSRIALNVFGIPPSPAVEVMVGRDGWLFYTGNNSLAYIEGKNPFSGDELAAWKRGLRQRNAWLAKRGIRYLVLFAPDKPSIYPEYLPEWVHPSAKGTRLDQLVDAMKECPEVELLDLRGPLLEAKKTVRVYQPSDTHWNAIGAYHAYDAIMRRVSRWFPDASPVPLAGFNLAWGNDPGGDLAIMLDVQGLVSERRPWIAPKVPSQIRTTVAGEYVSLRRWPQGQEPTFTERPSGAAPRAVVFCDSFIMALVPFLSEHFGRTVYLWVHDFEPSVIERERPDVVIQECAERLLSVVGPENPPTLAAERVVNPGAN